MERYIISLKDLCLVASVLACAVFACIGLFFGFTDWNSVYRDVETGVYKFSQFNIVNEFPVSEETLQKLLAGQDFTSRSKPISTDVTPVSYGFTNHFWQQAESQLQLTEEQKDSSVGKKYAVFVDLPTAELHKLKEPVFYVKANWDPYTAYYNGKKITQRAGRNTIVGLGLPETTGAEYDRLVFVFDSTFKGKLAGFYLSEYTSIRETTALAIIAGNAGLSTYFNFIAASFIFFAIGLFALFMALLTPSFIDLWGLSAFSLSMGLCIWTFSPFYEATSHMIETRVALIALHTVAATIMSLGFFRIEGRTLKVSKLFTKAELRKSLFPVLLLGGVLASCFFICIRAMHFENLLTGDALAFTFGQLAAIFLAAQIVVCIWGFRSITFARKSFAAKGLIPQVFIMNQRLRLAAFYSVCVLSDGVWLNMCLRYTSSASLGKFTLMSGTLPALAIIVMLYLMFMNSLRFQKRYAPKLNQIDYEVMSFGEKALDKTYIGTFVAFDIVGTKALNEILDLSHLASDTLPHFFNMIEADLSHLVQRSVTFKYKSNGDEFIFVLWAKNYDEARDLLSKLYQEWHIQSAHLIAKWQDDFALRIGRLGLPIDPVDLTRKLDMHVMMGILTNIRITMKGNEIHSDVHPDFLDPKFTALSGLFKQANSRRIAMFADDARAIGLASQFETSSKEGMGFVTFEAQAVKDAS